MYNKNYISIQKFEPPMQMIDVKTNSPPLYIVRIEVEQLFGRYNYVLSKKEQDIHDKINSPLMILYGDNGSGKTTILKILFHLLSPHPRHGHRKFLTQINFTKFSVILSDGNQIIASRNNSHTAGYFRLQILHNQNSVFDEVIGHEYDRQKQQLLSDEFCNKLIELKLNMFSLGDDRLLKSDILIDDNDNDLYEGSFRFSTRRMTTSSSVDFLDNNSLINRDIILKTSIKRAEKWISDQAFTGTNQGEINVHNIYEEMLTKIIQNSENEIVEKLPKSPNILINELRNADNISKNFARFGLMSPLESQKIINILNNIIFTQNSQVKSTISSVLNPYLDSVYARFKALESIQSLLTTFESTINKFFHDKYIKIHVTDGIKIFTDENIELSSENLSSGEKQLLLLFCNTLTVRDKATIFIIDEPEISLNVKWQRQLIDALLELTKNSQVQFILATHSIELLSKYKSHVIKLVKTEK
ncbi:MAG: hypothetical protein EAZ87_22335 [Nostocales cyanobacterium]|nr:MAG: hypothetical protein EAZ87_22335 [Nostocales cyanobacterium]